MHEHLGHSHDRTFPDHHPLTSEEVAEILAFMEVNASSDRWLDGLIRLCQGIPGMTCPRPAEGEVAEKELELHQLLTSNPQEGPTQEMVSAIMALFE